MKRKPAPKFIVGKKVRMASPTLYNETEGVITEQHELHREINPVTGKFIKGACNVQVDLHDISYKVTPLGNDRFELYWIHTGKTEIVGFYCYSYTVKSKKMNTAYPEKYLTLVGK